MPSFQIFCESCGADYSIEIFQDSQKRQPSFCACCGEKLDENSVAEQKGEQAVTDDWDVDDLDPDVIDDWRWTER